MISALRKLLDLSLLVLSEAGEKCGEASLERLRTSHFSFGRFSSFSGTLPAHFDLLDLAIQNIDETQFLDLKLALSAVKSQLHWKVDDGGYYEKEADVGIGYRDGNMHALLVGPQHAPIRSENVLVGLFLLAPWTLYRDHQHLAPEIYVPLTGPSEWRFDFGEWEMHPTGSVIYNAPNVIHATAVNEIPFLALFAWTGDVHSRCLVADANDWGLIEKRLEDHKKFQGSIDPFAQ